MIIYANTKSKRRKPSKKQIRLNESHAEYIKSLGCRSVSNEVDRSYNMPEPIVKKSLPSLSNAVGNGFKRSVDDYKWKRGCEESAATIKAIEEKKKRLAPIANKTGYQYITDGADVETLGRKV